MDDEARSLAEDAGEPLSTTAAAAGGAADIDDSLYSRQRYVLVSAAHPLSSVHSNSVTSSYDDAALASVLSRRMCACPHISRARVCM
jgi:hypothetical protein